jgi:hypothetical protein
MARKRRETDIDQFGGIQISVKVPELVSCVEESWGLLYSPAGPDRSWNDDTTSIDCLPDIRQIDPSGDFFDQHGSQAFRSQLFVHAEEIDLGGLKCPTDEVRICQG